MNENIQCIFDDFAQTAMFRVEFDDSGMKDDHELMS